MTTSSRSLPLKETKWGTSIMIGLKIGSYKNKNVLIGIRLELIRPRLDALQQYLN